MIEDAWISKLLRDAAFTWRPRELSCRLKKMTYFREFCYFVAKLGNRCFFRFPSAMLVHIWMGTSMASPYKSLLIWVKRFFGYLVYEIFLWPESWRGSLYICLVSFPRFWTLSIERFDFHFDLFWMAWHWKPAIIRLSCLKGTGSRLSACSLIKCLFFFSICY